MRLDGSLTKFQIKSLHLFKASLRSRSISLALLVPKIFGNEANYLLTKSRLPYATRIARPLSFTRFNNLRDVPLGCFSPCSHCFTVDVLVFKYLAKTG